MILQPGDGEEELAPLPKIEREHDENWYAEEQDFSHEINEHELTRFDEQ